MFLNALPFCSSMCVTKICTHVCVFLCEICSTAENKNNKEYGNICVSVKLGLGSVLQ